MKKALLLTASAYALILLLLAAASQGLKALRTRIVDSFTVGDLALVAAIFLYGLFIYTAGVYIIRGSCKDRHRDT